MRVNEWHCAVLKKKKHSQHHRIFFFRYMSRKSGATVQLQFYGYPVGEVFPAVRPGWLQVTTTHFTFIFYSLCGFTLHSSQRFPQKKEFRCTCVLFRHKISTLLFFLVALVLRRKQFLVKIQMPCNLARQSDHRFGPRLRCVEGAAN